MKSKPLYKITNNVFIMKLVILLLFGIMLMLLPLIGTLNLAGLEILILFMILPILLVVLFIVDKFCFFRILFYSDKLVIDKLLTKKICNYCDIKSIKRNKNIIYLITKDKEEYRSVKHIPRRYGHFGSAAHEVYKYNELIMFANTDKNYDEVKRIIDINELENNVVSIDNSELKIKFKDENVKTMDYLTWVVASVFTGIVFPLLFALGLAIYSSVAELEIVEIGEIPFYIGIIATVLSAVVYSKIFKVGKYIPLNYEFYNQNISCVEQETGNLAKTIEYSNVIRVIYYKTLTPYILIEYLSSESNKEEIITFPCERKEELNTILELVRNAKFNV